MSQKHLEYLIAVVQRGSIKSAAKALGVTQPAISAALRKLESEFGVQLVTRNAQGSAPTIFGKSLYESALNMGSLLESAKRKIDALKDPSTGHLRIAAGPSVATGLITKLVAHLMETYPGIRIDHVIGNSYGDFEQRLLAEDIDIAFCCIKPEDLSRAIACTHVHNNPIAMIASAEHFSADDSVVSRDRLMTDYSWVVLRDDRIQRPPGTHPAPANNGGDPPLRVTVDDLGIIRQLALTTKAICFFPLEEALPDLEAGKLVEFYVDNIPTLDRPIYALTKADVSATPALLLLLEHLAQLNDPGMTKEHYRRLRIVPGAARAS